jgi:DNA-binding transcriptional LysR family regulator
MHFLCYAGRHSLGDPVKNIDLRVLAIVSELNRTRSVSQAAENLELSQSAVSMSLAKLRRHFNDPLFVRTSAGMEPTPHATELIALLKQAESLLQSALGHHVVFDPATSDRCFRIHSSDIAQVTILPRLMKAIGSVAPRARLELHRMSDATAKMLESGDADLAIGYVGPMGAGYCQQRLFKERLVCAVRADHPRIQKTITAEEYLRETHIHVSTGGTGHAILDKTLESQRLRRKIGLTLPSFLSVGPVLRTLDYVATLPEQIAQHISRDGLIRVYPLPIDVASYLIVQQWHERYTHDPASRWLRTLVADLFTSPKHLAAVPPVAAKRTRAQPSGITVVDKIPQEQAHGMAVSHT